MRSDWIISGVAHAAILGTALVSFAYSMPTPDNSQFMPVIIATADDVSKATRGQQDAPKPKPDPKLIADKIDVPKPPDELAPKVVDNKQEIKTDSATPKSDPKPDPKPADKPKPKTPDYKPDQIADLLKKDVNKQPKPDTSANNPATPPRDAPKFNADQVAALLDKRDPQRQVASADTINNQASVGAANGAAAQLSQSETDALRARLSSCWSPPPGVDASSKVVASIAIALKPDGSLAAPPVLVQATPSPLGPAFVESAKRAILSCQPFTMLRPEHYPLWKELQLDFDPKMLSGG